MKYFDFLVKQLHQPLYLDGFVMGAIFSAILIIIAHSLIQKLETGEKGNMMQYLNGDLVFGRLILALNYIKDKKKKPIKVFKLNKDKYISLIVFIYSKKNEVKNYRIDWVSGKTEFIFNDVKVSCIWN